MLWTLVTLPPYLESTYLVWTHKRQSDAKQRRVLVVPRELALLSGSNSEARSGRTTKTSQSVRSYLALRQWMCVGATVKHLILALRIILVR